MIAKIKYANLFLLGGLAVNTAMAADWWSYSVIDNRCIASDISFEKLKSSIPSEAYKTKELEPGVHLFETRVTKPSIFAIGKNKCNSAAKYYGIGTTWYFGSNSTECKSGDLSPGYVSLIIRDEFNDKGVVGTFDMVTVTDDMFIVTRLEDKRKVVLSTSKNACNKKRKDL